MLVGSEKFTARLEQLVDLVPDDRRVRTLKRFKRRPTIAQILAAVADHFGYAQPGTLDGWVSPLEKA